jgi:phosphatidate phosphatase APP1
MLCPVSRRGRTKRLVRSAAINAERRWDRVRLARSARRSPSDFRIITYLGHGSGQRVVVRGRVLDDPEPQAAVDGEGTWPAVRRTAARFLTDELPGVPLRVHLGSAVAETVSDAEGYFDLALDIGTHERGPWMVGGGGWWWGSSSRRRTGG